MMYFNSYGNPFFTIRKNSVRQKMMSIELFWINIKKEHKIHYHFFGIFETLIKILNKEISIKKMRRILFLSSISLASLAYSQTNCESLKKENEALQSTVKTLSLEN